VRETVFFAWGAIVEGRMADVVVRFQFAIMAWISASLSLRNCDC
jgi:hypothetical protein